MTEKRTDEGGSEDDGGKVEGTPEIEKYEVVNLPEEIGDEVPPAIAYLVINGVAYETDVDTLSDMGKEMSEAKRRAKAKIGGRSGSAVTPRELTVGVRQGLLFAGPRSRRASS